MKNALIAVLVAGALLGGCARSTAIYNVKDAPVTNALGKKLAAQQVRAAIVTAGTSLGWTMVDAGPHRLEATLKLRTHKAVVEIPYSEREYSLVYKSSENLDAGEGTIHNNYNGWVQNLDRAIKTEISRS